jgi:hypothetical protein
MRLQNCVDLNFAKVGVGKSQAWLNEIRSDEGNDRKFFQRGENTAMTAIVSMAWPPIRIFSDHVLPSLQVRLGNPRQFVFMRY